MSMKTALGSLLALLVVLGTPAGADDFPVPHDTQDPRGGPTPPGDALAGLKLPEGFRATLFAAEPDVRQPIAMAFDARGRLWVAENYTYAENRIGFDTRLRDRILILEDTDHDGRFDRRTVFWDRGMRLSSVEVGFGGVWAMCPPHLLHIPDRDGDDAPDGEPVVALDGWADGGIHHCLANGLRWGPDGWLYGRQGIQGTSRVGRPGTPGSRRVPLSGGIWRYHPTREVFDVVCQGTTNPWGLDWDEHGQAFFINTVIGHLWHVIPGAHYQRMYGQDPGASNLYGLIPQTADHTHWDTGEAWNAISAGRLTDGTDRAGGGHAHAGLLIYQGDDWPPEYRGDILALNLHGRRINRDRPARRGATYVATHRPDVISWSDPWFRGIDLISGPDGGVHVADWSDIGECHESDGVHRTSGRIYRITHGEPRAPEVRDVAALGDRELVDLQRHPNVWYARQARRVLQERAAGGGDMPEAREALREMFAASDGVSLRLRALWCLHAIGAAGEPWLIDRLDDPEEHVRTWAVLLLVDSGTPSDGAIAALERLSVREESGLVLTFLASAMQRLPVERRWNLAREIAGRGAFASDPVLPLMLWYGIEPAVITDPERAAALAGGSAHGILRRSIARRLAQEKDRPEVAGPVIRLLGGAEDAGLHRDILAGLADVHGDVRRADAPAGWEEASRALRERGDAPARALVRRLSAVFGDAGALEELRALAADESMDLADRRDAIRTLARIRPAGMDDLLRRLLAEPDLAAEAIRALAARDDAGTSRMLLDLYATLSPDAREAVLAALAARQSSATALVEAIRAGRILRLDVPAHVVRQLRYWDDDPIPAIVEELWGRTRPVREEARARIAALRSSLDGLLPAADASRGRALFEKGCVQCHKLFGEGGASGPELTGSQRGDLGYLLENLIDPNATLAPAYRMSVLQLADGRAIHGLILERTEDALAIQTPTERISVPGDEIESETLSGTSLMPEGLLDALDEREIADLIRYLQAPAQVPLPAASE
jgi:putative membrane-bound dehydrogenase-like protein